MTVTAVGEITVLAAMPPAVTPLLAVSADLEAKIAALANFAVVLPSIQVDLAVSAEVTAGLTVSASLGITPPSIEVQLALTLAVLAELKITLDLLLGFMDLLAASAHVYAVETTVGAIGSELDTELAAGLPGGTAGDAGFMLAFVATAPAAVTALKSLFKTTP